MSLDITHLRILDEIVPGVIDRESIDTEFTLSPEKMTWSKTLPPGYIELLNLFIVDEGRHVGADIEFSIIPLTRSGSKNIASDKGSPRTLYTTFFSNQLGRLRCDRYSLDAGIYTVTADFLGGLLPMFHNYILQIRYPRKTEVGDDVALEYYGSPVYCRLRGFVYKVDYSKALEAEIQLRRMSRREAVGGWW